LITYHSAGVLYKEKDVQKYADLLRSWELMKPIKLIINEVNQIGLFGCHNRLDKPPLFPLEYKRNLGP
jgi:hypothetical protein